MRQCTADGDSAPLPAHHPQPAVPELRADFADLEHLCASVRDWDLDFRPLSVDGAPGQIARIIQQQHGDLAIAYARVRASIDQLGAPPSGTLTFGVLGAGTRRLWWRGKDLGADTVLAFPVGGELRSISGPDFEVHTVSVPEDLVARLAERVRLPLPTERCRAEDFRPPADTLAALRRSLTGLHRPDARGSRREATRIAETLVLAWLRAQDERAQRHTPEPARRRDRAMRACLARLEHPDWPELSPSQLCEAGCVGERTLQYAFRERFGLTPAAFLKARRLAAVRNALRRAAPEASVADIAAAFGFWHTGQFAADYRRAFAEAPSATLQQGRIEAGEDRAVRKKQPIPDQSAEPAAGVAGEIRGLEPQRLGRDALHIKG